MVRHSVRAGVLAVVILLVAVPFVAAVDEEASSVINSGTAFNFNRPFRGFVRIDGHFTRENPVATVDLGSPTVEATIVQLLNEGVGGELADLPPTLTSRLRSRRIAVFETVPGTEPFGRLTVRTCIPELEGCPNSSGLNVNDFEFRLEVQLVTIAAPECVVLGGGETVLDTLFRIVDGPDAVIVRLPGYIWECFNNNRNLRNPPAG
jgi:hypothetical protein